MGTRTSVLWKISQFWNVFHAYQNSCQCKMFCETEIFENSILEKFKISKLASQLPDKWAGQTKDTVAQGVDQPSCVLASQLGEPARAGVRSLAGCPPGFLQKFQLNWHNAVLVLPNQHFPIKLPSEIFQPALATPLESTPVFYTTNNATTKIPQTGPLWIRNIKWTTIFSFQFNFRGHDLWC